MTDTFESPVEELEWAARQYQVATEYLLEVLRTRADDEIPVRIVRAISRRWSA